MTDPARHPDAAGHDTPIVDVWSRTEPKYRRRAIVLLFVNVVLFAGLASVAYWLREGAAFAPARLTYFQELSETFNPTPETRHTPTGLSLGPIKCIDVPIMIPILGLILAALVSIPILVTMLYRLPCALPFVAAVGLVAVMPWLAIALLASCLIVSVNPLRIRSRFTTALLSLLPVILYFFLGSRQAGPVVAPLADPSDQVKLVAPLILAIIGSAVVMGIVLIIASIVRYRPGAIAPLLATLFLAPVALFEFEVGRDELHYRILERDYGPGSEYFVRENLQDMFDASVERGLLTSESANPSYEAVRDTTELRWMLALDTEADFLFTAYQDRAAMAAERFVRAFPDSVHAPNALYIQGRALDMRVDMSAFRKSRELSFYDEFPSPRSRRAWELIEHNAPESPLAAEALLRLAALDARDGDVDGAVRRLDRLIQAFHGVDPQPSLSRPSGGADDFFKRTPPQYNFPIPVPQKLLAGRILRDFLSANRDPLWGDAPLVRLMRLDPRDERYVHNLRAILGEFGGCQITDNLQLRIAAAEVELDRRIAALRECAAGPRTADSLPESIYQLGVALQDAKDQNGARDAFNRLIGEFPESAWREHADARLRRLERAVQGGV